MRDLKILKKAFIFFVLLSMITVFCLAVKSINAASSDINIKIIHDYGNMGIIEDDKTLTNDSVESIYEWYKTNYNDATYEVESVAITSILKTVNIELNHYIFDPSVGEYVLYMTEICLVPLNSVFSVNDYIRSDFPIETEFLATDQSDFIALDETTVNYYYDSEGFSRSLPIRKSDTLQRIYNTDIFTDNLNTLSYEFLTLNDYTVTINYKEKITYTVNFESNGGNMITPITGITSGQKIEMPTNPIKDSHTFMGWYQDLELTDPWDFESDVVTSNITLYAKWQKKDTNIIDENKDVDEKKDNIVNEGKNSNNTVVIKTMDNTIMSTWVSLIVMSIISAIVIKRTKRNS
ncbi:MAG: InlB B-repeat-containing protein [Coprobacillaceae bacterium]